MSRQYWLRDLLRAIPLRALPEIKFGAQLVMKKIRPLSFSAMARGSTFSERVAIPFEDLSDSHKVLWLRGIHKVPRSSELRVPHRSKIFHRHCARRRTR